MSLQARPRASSLRPEVGPANALGEIGSLAGLALALLVAYVGIYPALGLRVPIGSDAPVYVWWAHLASASGIGPLGTGVRPGIVGLLADLAVLTHTSVDAVAAAFAPLSATLAGLSTGVLVESALGRGRLRFALVSAFAALYLSTLAQGYLSSLAYLALFGAALVTLSEGLPALAPGALLAVTALLAAAGLSEPLFIAVGAGVSAGVLVALVPAFLRDRRAGAPLGRTALARLVAVWAGSLALVGAGLGASAAGPIPGGPLADTSRDSFLRRHGMGAALRGSYVTTLRNELPWPRTAALLVLAATPLAVPRRSRSRGLVTTLRAWWAGEVADRAALFWGATASSLVMTAGGVVLLLAGTGAPGQRLAACCLAIPALAGIGLAGVTRRGAARRRRLARTLAAVGSLAFVVATWSSWAIARPMVGPSVPSDAAAAARALATLPEGTPLVLVTDSTKAAPTIFVARFANYLRAAVPPPRVADVYVYVGWPTDFVAGRPGRRGSAEYDALAADYWRALQPALRRHPLAVVVRAFNPAAFRAALAIPGSRRLAPGVVSLPVGSPPAARPAARVPADAGPAAVDPGLMSPWTPVWLAPALLALAALLGWGWAAAALPRSRRAVHLAVAPGFGLAGLMLVAVAGAAAGLPLAGAGAWIAAAVTLAGGLAVLVARRRTEAPPAPVRHLR